MAYKNFKEFLKAEVNLDALNLVFWSPSNLTPNFVVNGFENLNADELIKRGIKALVIDYDGVVCPYHSLKRPPSKNEKKLHELNKLFKVCILSNRRGELVKALKNSFPDYTIIKSKKMKPNHEPYENALKYLESDREKIALIEDRLITGIAGGNRVGMYTVWVDPPEMDGPEHFSVRSYRVVEKLVYKLYGILGLSRKYQGK